MRRHPYQPVIHDKPRAASIDMNPALCYKDRPCGAVAQLGERLNGIQEVVGSIPIGSTRFRSRPSDEDEACHGGAPSDL